MNNTEFTLPPFFVGMDIVTSKKPSNDEICDHKMNTVYSIASRYSTVWKLVALALGTPPNFITKVYKKESDSVQKCQEILQYWFDINGEGSIDLLYESLDHSFIGDELKSSGVSLHGAHPDYSFQNKIRENYTEMIVKLIKVLDKRPEYLQEILLRLQHYPGDVDTYESVKTINDIFSTLKRKGQLSTLDLSKLKYLIKHIGCKEGQYFIEEYEESIKDEPIADELSWCLKWCQDPDRYYIYARIKGDPRIITYGQIKMAKEAVSNYVQESESNLMLKCKGKGSVILFWDVPEEIAKNLQLPKVTSLSIKQDLCNANIIEVGICIKQRKSHIFVEEIVVSAASSKF